MFRYALVVFISSALAAAGPSSAQSVQSELPSAAAPRGGRFAMAACRDDMKILCGSVAAGGGRKIACLKDNQAKLSTSCQSAIQGVLDKRGLGSPVQAQVPARGGGNLKQVCQADIAAQCAGMVPSQGAIVKCLQEKSGSLSQLCQGALTVAKADGAVRKEARQTCSNDLIALCPSLKGHDAMVCLQQKVAATSAACQQALNLIQGSQIKGPQNKSPEAAAKPL